MLRLNRTYGAGFGRRPHRLVAIPPRRGRIRQEGFTLMELCVVLVIIGIISAVAAPELMPLLTYSQLEGEARQLSGFGTESVAEASLFKESLFIRFDLDRQEYYAVHLVYPDVEGEEGDAGGEKKPQTDQMAMLNQYRKSSGMSASQMSDMLAGKKNLDPKMKGALPSEFDEEEADQQMNDKFNRFARKMLETRSKNVKHKDSMLDEAGPLFEKKFTLKEEEPIEEELGGVLGRIRMPEGVTLEAVSVDGQVKKKGVVEAEISSLGLANVVGFHLVNDDGEYMTVYWDPISSRGSFVQGKGEI